MRDWETLMEKVQDAIDDDGIAAISVFCDIRRSADNDGMSLRELCAQSEVPHSKVQVSTVSRLSRRGFVPESDVSDGQPNTHHHVILEQPVEQSRLEAFIACFDEPVSNPTGGMRRAT